jgi:hypothetical protein
MHLLLKLFKENSFGKCHLGRLRRGSEDYVGIYDREVVRILYG